MFLNKHKFLQITLKNRMALSYALLFFTSCALIFWLMVSQVSAMLNRAEDSGIRLVASEVELIYMTGPRFDRFGSIRPGTDYPAEDRAVLERKFPGIDIRYVSRAVAADPSGGPGARRIYHTAFAGYHGGIYELRVQNGQVAYSRKINATNHLPYLRQYFNRQLYARGYDNLFLGIYNSDGSRFLTTDMLDDSKAGAGSKPPFQAVNSKDFNFLDFSLPDGRKLTAGRSIRHLEEVRREYALLFFGLLGAVTLAGMCVGWLISRRFIRGIRRTTLAMARISSGDYSYRIEDLPEGDREIRELMETFNAMNARTEALLRELKSISDDVAHDLRTPLTRISGIVELLLRDRNLNDQVRTACASAAEEITRMRELIDTMLEITRANSNPKEISKTDLDLCGLLGDFCELMQPAFEEKGLELRVRLPDEPLRIPADKTKFPRVISNLLENALKFTSKGRVEVVAERVADGIEIRISDTGCGIEESDQKRVFERFFQCDPSRNLPGNGLGLALVKAVVKAHGWDISVHSVPGEGTTFTISIPNSALA